MLSIAAMTAGQEGYYVSLAREDYYFSGGEPEGEWLGEGAAELGLRGRVDPEHLSRVLAGLHPHTGRPLVQIQHYRDGRQRQPGHDLTCSVPKPVSVAWSVAPVDQRPLFPMASERALKAMFDYLQATAFTRRGHGGSRREVARLIVAIFLHFTSRALDPQIHVHSLVGNLCTRHDGSFGTIVSLPLYQHKMAAGALYRAELAYQLRSLGFEPVPEGVAFTLQGVRSDVVKAFSKRRAEVLEALDASGHSDAKAAEVAARTSRSVKEHVACSELFERWKHEADALGFSFDQIVRHEQRPEPSSPDRRSLGGEIRNALASVTTHQSHFAERDLVRAVAEQCQSGFHQAHHIVDSVRETISTSKEVVHLGVVRGELRFTTPEMLAVERRFLDDLEHSRNDTIHVASSLVVSDVLEKRKELSEEQREAIRRITATPGSIQCLQGLAGSGKTYVLDAAREIWEREGFSVIGCALAARAAHQLEQGSKIGSATIASLLFRLSPPVILELKHHAQQLVRAALGKPTQPHERFTLGASTILVVDEMGMVGTRQATALTEAARRAGAKLIFMGDTRQLQPIEAGGPFAAAIDRLGAATLDTITRQHEEWMRDAVRQFAEGDARGALTQYALAECLEVAKDATSAMKSLVNRWVGEHTELLRESLILASSNEEVRTLNGLAQTARLAQGGLNENESVVAGDLRLFTRDRVIFSQNDRALGVLNGDVGTIESITRSRLGFDPIVTVRLDRQRWEGKRLTPVRATLTLAEAARTLDLAYAMTTHKSQGMTVDRAFVLAGGAMQDRELTYVQMSRARERTRIFMAAKDADEDLRNLIDSMGRSRQKQLVHNLVPNLQSLTPER